MFANLKFKGALVVLVCCALVVMLHSASAVSVSIIEKCHSLTAKAFPPRELGNPAAGSTKGTGQEEQEYFKKCVANASKTDDDKGTK